ncbi:MAG: hypothetical protein L6R37_007380 [Teloschistes peruensis]|nr:MAG: hypothetical protein L6R37_007380 [Teloschistes peruensis]
MTVPLDLTIGVEIELVVYYDIRRYEGFLSSDYGVFDEPKASDATKLNRLVRADIIECLRRKGLPVNGLLDAPKEQDTISCWTISVDESIRTAKEERTNEWDEARYTGVEIKTPALYYSQSSFVQIQDVTNILKQNFTLLTNDSCGLHVHVGNRSHGFPLTTIKNLGLFAKAFERQFNSLHPIERIDKPHQYYRPPTRAWGKFTVPETMASEIETYDDLCELVNKLNDAKGEGLSRYSAHNFMNMTPATTWGS